MSASEFLDALSGKKELEITVKGRVSGRAISLPVWFVLEGNRVLLLPVEGSRTNWYRNIRREPKMILTTGRKKVEARAEPSEDRAEVDDVIRKFRAKYGDTEIEKWYSVFDTCVRVIL